MEFVYMTHPGVTGGARVPATAVPHWEGNGWVRGEEPAKPPRPSRFVTPTRPAKPDPVETSTTADPPKPRTTPRRGQEN